MKTRSSTYSQLSRNIKGWLLKVIKMGFDFLAFKLMELTIDEIFEALSIIETDASKIWTSLANSYPKNYFDGVIEDTYGVFLDIEA